MKNLITITEKDILKEEFINILSEKLKPLFDNNFLSDDNFYCNY
jgi:hypothetical protein